MIRLFVYLVIILAFGFGFAWVADNPGVVTLNWQGTDIRTSLMVVVVAMVVLLGVLLFVWGLVRGVIGLPNVITKFFTNRRRDKGYQALSKGLIAAGTGDKTLARRLTKESGKLLTNEPLIALLDAQTSLLEGNHAAARNQFHAMLENEDTRLLGLRGLYLEAEQEGAREASRQYAEQASQLAPSLDWAGNAKLRNLTLDNNWEEALRTLEQNRSAGLVDKETAMRQRAVLLTARATEEEPAHPELAAKLALEANRLAPDLVPAAVIGAAALVRGNNLRKASKLVERVWKVSPHPELAETYVHMRMGDSASDRLARAQALAKFRPNHPEGNIMVALAAMDAKQWDLAREMMKPVVTNHLSERACLIMADLEEFEHGDAGRMREWLAKAVRAPRDARWTADGFASDNWLPISPVTGKIDAFEWKIPVSNLQEPSEKIEIGDLAEPLKIAPVVEISQPEVSKQDTVEGQATDSEQVENSPPTDPAPVAAGVSDDVEKKTDSSASKTDGADQPEIIDLAPNDNEPEKNAGDLEKSDAAKVALKMENAKSEPQEAQPTVFVMDRRPDDPGVSKKDDNEKFKIF